MFYYVPCYVKTGEFVTWVDYPGNKPRIMLYDEHWKSHETSGTELKKIDVKILAIYILKNEYDVEIIAQNKDPKVLSWWDFLDEEREYSGMLFKQELYNTLVKYNDLLHSKNKQRKNIAN